MLSSREVNLFVHLNRLVDQGGREEEGEEKDEWAGWEKRLHRQVVPKNRLLEGIDQFVVVHQLNLIV